MTGDVIYWSKDYLIGVDKIDDAHQEFFNILRRLIIASQDKGRHQWIAEEGLGFLKQYAAGHFAEEEAFMLSIGYEGIERHQAQHEAFKQRILPKIEARLRRDQFSEEALERFLRIMRLWLARHIMIHDKAICARQESGAPHWR